MVLRTLSTQIDDDRKVPDLWNDNGTWKLNLDNWDNDWNSDYRFLAVRNNRRFRRGPHMGRVVFVNIPDPSPAT